MANHQFGLYRSYATINLPASSACNDSAENWADARAPSCFKVRKSSRTARSRRRGLSFPDRGQVIFPACAARAALKATLGKAPTEHWIVGSNDVVMNIAGHVAHSAAHRCIAPLRTRCRHHDSQRVARTFDGDRYDALHAFQSGFQGSRSWKTGKHCYKSATPCTKKQQWSRV